jgi:hypothetical protein
MQQVGMEMQHVEIVGLLHHIFEHRDVCGLNEPATREMRRDS